MRIDLVPLNSSSLSSECYTISSVELRIAEPKFFANPHYIIDWKEVDQLCADNFKEFTVGVDPIHSDSERLQLSLLDHFPKLAAKDRINVKLAYWRVSCYVFTTGRRTSDNSPFDRERLSDGTVSIDPMLSSYISVSHRIQSALEHVPEWEEVWEEVWVTDSKRSTRPR